MNFTKYTHKGIIRSILLLFCGMVLLSSVAAQNANVIPSLKLQNTSTPEPILENTEDITETTSVEAVLVNTTTATPFPDWAMTSKDTNGLLIAGIFILLIIIVGTLTAMTKNIVQHSGDR